MTTYYYRIGYADGRYSFESVSHLLRPERGINEQPTPEEAAQVKTWAPVIELDEVEHERLQEYLLEDMYWQQKLQEVDNLWYPDYIDKSTRNK
jgi:hypothetical protein